MFDTIRELFEKGTFCDVVLHDSESQDVLKCHSLVLCSAIPSFKPIFQAHDDVKDENIFHLTIVNARFAAVKGIIHAIYHLLVEENPKHSFSDEQSWASELGLVHLSKSTKPEEIEEEEKPQREKWSCKVEGCGAEYFYLKWFNAHMDFHKNKLSKASNGSLPVVCEICGESYKSDFYLYNHHRNFHKKHHCKNCNQAFIGRNALLKHNRSVHATDQDYVCDICGKSFRLRSYLANHKNSHHSVELPFQCSYCGKKFAKKDKYALHESSVHLGKKAFKCRAAQCSLAFTTPSVRKLHEKSAHNLDIRLPRGRIPRSTVQSA